MKKRVVRISTSDGVEVCRTTELRTIYTKKDGTRYVQDQWKRQYPLSDTNEYMYEWRSI